MEDVLRLNIYIYICMHAMRAVPIHPPTPESNRIEPSEACVALHELGPFPTFAAVLQFMHHF